MVAAPPSCRAATYRAPAATIALVTAKLPDPTTPKTCETPHRTSAAPTASATFMKRRSPAFHEGQHAGRRAGTGHDRQRRGDEQDAGRRQLGQVLQLREPVLAAAHERRVARERRIEGVRRAGVGADRLDADTDDRRLLPQPRRTGRGDAG